MECGRGKGPLNEASNIQGEITQMVSQADFPFTCPLASLGARGGLWWGSHTLVMWDVISTCSTWVYEPIKCVRVCVVLYMIKIIILECVVLLDLTRVTVEYYVEKG